nr:IS1380 polypeptide homolog - Bradyrhizobium japonicum [Bradyrhizobium japonicum]
MRVGFGCERNPITSNRERHARHDRRYDSALLVSSRSRQESHSCLRWWAPNLERGRDASGDGRRRDGLGLANNLARVFPDRRDPTRVMHSLVDMFRARMFAICCGYEDADDLDHLRSDPAFKLAADGVRTRAGICVPSRAVAAGECSRLRDVIRLTYILVDAWMDSYPRDAASVTLDIDDTCDVVHGHQQLSLFNAHYDERCFLPIHVYDTEKSRPVLRAAARQDARVEVRAHLRRLVRHIRTRWHNTQITFRGERTMPAEAMAWCETNGIDYIFGLSAPSLSRRKVDEVADDIRTRRAHREPAGSAWLYRDDATRQSPGIANGPLSPY